MTQEADAAEDPRDELGALCESASRADRLYAEAPIGMLIVDPDMTVVHIDGAMLSWCERSREQCLDRPLLEALPNVNRTTVTAMRYVLATGEVRSDLALRAEIESPAMPEARWTVTCSPVRGRSGEVIGACLLASDVTDVRREQLRLRASYERKEEFLAILGHELRNPLAAIRNSVTALESTTPGDRSVAWVPETLSRQVDTLLRLVDDLLDATRLEKGKLRLRRRAVDVRDAVSQSAVDRRTRARGPRTHDRELRAGTPRVGPRGHDATRAGLREPDHEHRQVHPQGRARPGGDPPRPDRTVEVSVTDTGVGLDETALLRIFEPFSQIRRRGTARAGLGIGLTLARKLVELHGGSLDAFSSGVGDGSRFTVSLPRCDPPERVAVRSKKSKDAKPRGKSGRVLLVDDHADLLNSLSFLLRREGFEVVTAADGRSALTLLQPGFFAAFIRYRAWGKEHDTEQFPVIMRAKNEVREIPRSYLDHKVSKHKSRTKWVHAGHTLLHDLKENVVTPYVMVESLGWFYGLPIFGKTLVPSLYRRWTSWLRRLFVPAIATTLTVDKMAPAETAEMLAAEHHAIVRKVLHEHGGLRSSRITPALVEALRQHALNGQTELEPALVEPAQLAGLSTDTLRLLVDILRRQYDLTARAASRQKERITRTGFTVEEQTLTVDTALRMMGLTNNLARLVLFCAHGSTSENNPYESALDCGACGGNEGKPNARVLAMMANNQKVRERLAKNKLVIPPDTHFLAGQVDTTTDEVQLFDLEDVPPTHRADLARLQEDLKEASTLTSQERCTRFPEVEQPLDEGAAESHVRKRSVDWSQVRPEWGLSSNTAFVIGRRELTKRLNLDGRVFLQSYDARQDPSGRLLEVLLTGPQVVAQWINMEHYFSAVDNDVYGSGSKIYHNVVGRIGIMSGPWSDLRLGLARQTVMNGDVPYHEPMRLLTIVEAPRERIDKLIERHEILRHFYHNEWVHLVALDPDDQVWYRYRPTGEWVRIDGTL